VIGVIVRLQAMTLRGRVVRSLRLLRQPKYLIGRWPGGVDAAVGRPADAEVGSRVRDGQFEMVTRRCSPWCT
jgi:hypothetical protein